MKWEYLIDTYDLNQNPLNALGASGWELISVIPSTSVAGAPRQFLFVFKRPLQ